MISLSLTEARATLPTVLDRVAAGEQVTITRHGVAVAVVVRPDRLRGTRADLAFARADGIIVELERARERPLVTTSSSPGRVEELIDDLGRSRQDRAWTPSTPTS